MDDEESVSVNLSLSFSPFSVNNSHSSPLIHYSFSPLSNHHHHSITFIMQHQQMIPALLLPPFSPNGNTCTNITTDYLFPLFSYSTFTLSFFLFPPSFYPGHKRREVEREKRKEKKRNRECVWRMKCECEERFTFPVVPVKKS